MGVGSSGSIRRPASSISPSGLFASVAAARCARRVLLYMLDAAEKPAPPSLVFVNRSAFVLGEFSDLPPRGIFSACAIIFVISASISFIFSAAWDPAGRALCISEGIRQLLIIVFSFIGVISLCFSLFVSQRTL